MAFAVAAGQGRVLGQPTAQDGTLFTGAKVFAGFDGRRAEALGRLDGASAVLVEKGRIVAIGAEGELASTDAGRRARRVDLAGAFIYPGFQDTNGQLEGLGRDLERVDLSVVVGVDALVRALQERAAALPAGRWVQAVGWDSVSVGGRSQGERALLEARLSRAVPGHPVLLRDRSGDGFLLNDAGRAACGSEVAGIPPGRWLRGQAARGVLSRLPSPSAEDRARRILRAQDVLLRAGVTCVHVTDLDAAGASALARLRADGRLRIRVVGFLDAREQGSDEQWAEWERDPSGADRFEVVGVSLRLDGTLAVRGAALEMDYAGSPGQRGELSIDFGTASDLVVEAARSGRQPALRCAGDRAVGQALDILERARGDVPGFIGLRPRLEGLDLWASVEGARLKSLGAVPSVQPGRLGHQVGWASDWLGEDRVLRLQPWRTLLAETSQTLALGSGYPGAVPDPRVIFFSSVSRRSIAAPTATGFLPGQSLTANETLGGMTSGAAFAATQEDRRGLLARGYGGDLTVLDVDLTQLSLGDAHRALEATVLMTVVNGEILHDAR